MNSSSRMLAGLQTTEMRGSPHDDSIDTALKYRLAKCMVHLVTQLFARNSPVLVHSDHVVDHYNLNLLAMSVTVGHSRMSDVTLRYSKSDDSCHELALYMDLCVCRRKIIIGWKRVPFRMIRGRLQKPRKVHPLRH